MDNTFEAHCSYLEDKYLEDNAKFHQGDTVYFQYTYTKENQHKLGVSIGIVTDRFLTKREVNRGDKSYVTHDITYKVVHPRGITKVNECNCTSVSEYIFREYLKHSQPKTDKDAR